MERDLKDHKGKEIMDVVSNMEGFFKDSSSPSLLSIEEIGEVEMTEIKEALVTAKVIPKCFELRDICFLGGYDESRGLFYYGIFPEEWIQEGYLPTEEDGLNAVDFAYFVFWDGGYVGIRKKITTNDITIGPNIIEQADIEAVRKIGLVMNPQANI